MPKSEKRPKNHCKACGGSGMDDGVKCLECGGTGKEPVRELPKKSSRK